MEVLDKILLAQVEEVEEGPKVIHLPSSNQSPRLVEETLSSICNLPMEQPKPTSSSTLSLL